MDSGEPPVIGALPTPADILWLCANPRCSLAMVEIEGVYVPMLLDEQGRGPVIPKRDPQARPWPKHPGAVCPGRTGAFGLNSGDRFVYDLDGRTGWADEFTSDGDALVCWDDGTYGTVKWNWMSPEPTPQSLLPASALKEDGRK